LDISTYYINPYFIRDKDGVSATPKFEKRLKDIEATRIKQRNEETAALIQEQDNKNNDKRAAVWKILNPKYPPIRKREFQPQTTRRYVGRVVGAPDYVWHKEYIPPLGTTGEYRPAGYY
jgi:hypothetical protein